MRWLRSHTQELSIDPHRVVGAGDSAGGHVVLSSTLLGEASEMPSAWIQFNSVVDTTAMGYKIGLLLFEGRERPMLNYVLLMCCVDCYAVSCSGIDNALLRG